MEDIVPVQLTIASAANHVVPLLYKIEFAGENGFIGLSCTLKEQVLGITLVIKT